MHIALGHAICEGSSWRWPDPARCNASFSPAVEARGSDRSPLTFQSRCSRQAGQHRRSRIRAILVHQPTQERDAGDREHRLWNVRCELRPSRLPRPPERMTHCIGLRIRPSPLDPLADRMPESDVHFLDSGGLQRREPPASTRRVAHRARRRSGERDTGHPDACRRLESGDHVPAPPAGRYPDHYTSPARARPRSCRAKTSMKP